MRVSKFLAGSLFLAALTVGFVSCKNKDKEPDDPFNNGGNNNTPGQTDDTTAKGDGTEADPYNVQALLDMKTDGTLPDKDAGTEKAWVEGYIVGSYVFDNDPKFVIGADPTVKDNVLIADDANTTDTYAVSALKLGNYSTIVSLVNVPENLKKKIKVYGVIEKYCGVSGVINLEKVYIDGTVVELPGNTDVEVNDNMTPSEAHAAAASLQAGAVSSNKAGVTGYVSKIATAYSSQYDNITIYMSDNQDTQETFYVYRMKGGSALKVGDKIKVTGNLTNYKGTSPQMNTGATYELLESVGGGSGEGEGGGSGEGEGGGSGEGGSESGSSIQGDFGSAATSKTMPTGWTYISNNPTKYPNPSWYSTGLKFNYENMGVQSPAFEASTTSVKVEINVVLNANSKTSAASENAFTITGFNAADEEVNVATIANTDVISGTNEVTLTGAGITYVKVIMTGYPYNGTQYCNVNLSEVAITVE